MANVGDIARRTRTVQQHDIELFTALTGDRNPLHYDEAAAAASRFGGILDGTALVWQEPLSSRS